jgi:hypothetical protein
MPSVDELEKLACTPKLVKIEHFNKKANIPYGLTTQHICDAMNDFIGFLRMVNGRLNDSGSARFETILMPANFSSMVGEFMASNIPKHCKGLVKNRYHNGHPDLIPAGRFPKDSAQYEHEGIELKGSRYLKGWQGHNPEDIWLMVVIFDSNRPVDEGKNIGPKAFRYLRVIGAQLEKKDWLFAGRSAESRRTITASVTNSGYRKMMENWIYNAPE